MLGLRRFLLTEQIRARLLVPAGRDLEKVNGDLEFHN